jgi:hypothetical protein
MIDAMKKGLEALEALELNDYSGYEISKHRSHIVDEALAELRQAIAEAEKQPSTSGVIFAVEQSIEAGDCPMGIELAYEEYKAKLKGKNT